jgi:hypothetical protein
MQPHIITHICLTYMIYVCLYAQCMTHTQVQHAVRYPTWLLWASSLMQPHIITHICMIYMIYVCIYAQCMTHTGTTRSLVSNVAAVSVLTHAATHYYAHMYDIYNICMHIRTTRDTHRYNMQSGIQRGCCGRPHSCSHTIICTYV